MKRSILAPLASLVGLVALTAGPAAAQNIYPYRAPSFGPGYQTQLSPYLNFLRGGDPAANYFLGVLPEFQRRQDRNIFASQIQGLGTLLPAPPRITERDIDTPLPSTGHATAFNYTGSYFNSSTISPVRSQGNAFPTSQINRQGQRWPNNAPSPAGMPPTPPPKLK
jgi:hypothetical protein